LFKFNSEKQFRRSCRKIVFQIVFKFVPNVVVIPWSASVLSS